MNDKDADRIGAPYLEMPPQPKASEWLWRSWYAKLWWALTLLYWISLEGLMVVPAGKLNSGWVGVFMLLVLLFNPLTVLGVLGYGYARAKIARGDWIITSVSSDWNEERQRRDREAADFNPADARSGWHHLEYLDLTKH